MTRFRISVLAKWVDHSQEDTTSSLPPAISKYGLFGQYHAATEAQMPWNSVKRYCVAVPPEPQYIRHLVRELATWRRPTSHLYSFPEGKAKKIYLRIL